MPAVLDVAPAGYRAAATALGESVAGLLRLAWGELCLGLDGTGGMGGSDDAGASWADGYDRACASAGRATTDVVNASFVVASLLDQTGINYGEAEAASMAGGVPPFRQARYRGRSVQSLGLPPSALGGDYAPPGGWNELARRIGAVWPNGHQDRLRAAAHAWTVASDQAYGLLPEIDRALADLAGQRSPESRDVQVVLGSLRDSIAELAASWRSIGRSCTDYAHHLDEAHHALTAELRSFLEWTAVIEAASALFATVTAGLSAIGGQAGEARWIAACAARVHSALDALSPDAPTRIAAESC